MALALVVGLPGPDARAARPFDEALLPAQDYTSAEARVLAEVHAGELRALYDNVLRCLPELDFQLDGIAFRLPRTVSGSSPRLSVWLWLDATRPPVGADTGARATDAFQRYARRLFGRLVARQVVFEDSRVGGYAIVLSWIGPRKIGGRPVAESLVVTSAKPEVAAFAAGTMPSAEFLASAVVRAFDGQTELPRPSLPVEDAAAPAGAAGC